ncbi:PIN domain protein [Limihaloglobus sulfuriphilus]|uniref:PIN domain protein n=1 Tax=Limihaloglobus sulfuriphilus TaxID=1851148 RepID=A0A1Q2MBZ0_9BACT|nr:PIN domain-containing protein [Limihaloglobus sulfuriphilus]AQQ70179.1 PIN domain protein [Limihaloglobus sulfuriphilus]
MSSNVIEAESYEFSAQDKLIVDTNVWIFNYGPSSPRKPQVRKYSRILSNALTAKCQIYIDVMIVSEFINTYARMKFNQIKQQNQFCNFKSFRNSSGFKAVARDIASDTRRILSLCNRIKTGFETVDIDKILTEFGQGNSDFNDQMITALCKREGLTLVTDDGDFAGKDIPIITANRRLLAP